MRILSGCESVKGRSRGDRFCLMESTEGRVIHLAGRNEQGGQNYNVEVAGPHELNDEGSGAEVGDQTKECDRVVQDEEVNIVVDEDVQHAVADKPKRTRKKGKPPVVLVVLTTLPDNALLIHVFCGSLEVIPSSKGIKFKCLQSLESKIEKKKKDQGCRNIQVRRTSTPNSAYK
ncbi:hypothetical protein Tco_0296815 [Tanacetum coccineum]